MDHYTILGVPRTATADEIKKAYRKLASQHHPDKGGDTVKFQQIQSAYDTLSDPQKREHFDTPHHGFRTSGMPNGFNFGRGGPADINDFMAEIIRQQMRDQQTRVQTFRTTIFITLEQVCNGGEQPLKIQTPNGNHVINVTIPKGIPDGGSIRLDDIIDGATLLAEFRTHKHLRFDRHGNDLVSNHPVSVLDLIVGTEFEFTTLSGKTLSVKIPPGTQPFNQLKLAGQGLPVYNSANFGDQILLLKPFLPDTIDQTITDSILQARTK